MQTQFTKAFEGFDLWPPVRAAITERTAFEWIVEEGATLTKAQLQTIEQLMNRYFDRRHNGKYAERYEFKQISVHVMAWGKISIVIETGSRTDEGTVASILCRDRVHAFVGKSGGISAEGKDYRLQRRRAKRKGLPAVVRISY